MSTGREEANGQKHKISLRFVSSVHVSVGVFGMGEDAACDRPCVGTHP